VRETIYPELARIDGQSINIATLDQAVEAAVSRARAGRGFRFFTLNLDHLVKRREDARFRAAYREAELISADGAPVAWLARRQTSGIRRTTGADLVEPLSRAAAEAGIPIALYGSTLEALQRAAEHLARLAPGLAIAHLEAPPFGFDPTSKEAEAAAERIAASGARIVFVALGAPKQEFFASHVSGRMPGLGLVCIGAALDFLAGTQTRAPVLLQRTGLEWLWRLAGNPARFAARYAKCVAVLFSLVLGAAPGAKRQIGA
jgi:exopolysaccharide biosynthesis WecB/TagA/CpsF family protein